MSSPHADRYNDILNDVKDKSRSPNSASNQFFSVPPILLNSAVEVLSVIFALS